MKGGRGSLALYVEEDRQQRAATILRDVSYVIEGRFDILSGENNPGKHLDQFIRRARSGACYHRAYLGCREFPADFALIENDADMPTVAPALEGERDLGYMLHDIDFADAMTPHFFRATMRNGVIEVPPLAGKGVVR
jgi:CRISPR-associated protein Cas5d